jgi:AcrR family transcriptional regulator
MSARPRRNTPRIPERPDLLAGEELAPEPRQQRSRDRRARLTTAALRLFGDKGYEAASVEEIARNAGMPVGAFYLHFRSKRQLLLSLMNDLMIGLSQVNLEPKAGVGARGILRQLLERGFAEDLRYVGAYRAWQEAVLSDPDLAGKQELIHAWTTARVAAVFRRLLQMPDSRAGVDVDALARVLNSLFWDLLRHAARKRDAKLERSIDATTHLIYHALFADHPRKGGAR